MLMYLKVNSSAKKSVELFKLSENKSCKSFKNELHYKQNFVQNCPNRA